MNNKMHFYAHVNSNLSMREAIKEHPVQLGHPRVHELLLKTESQEREISALKLEIEELRAGLD